MHCVQAPTTIDIRSFSNGSGTRSETTLSAKVFSTHNNMYYNMVETTTKTVEAEVREEERSLSEELHTIRAKARKDAERFAIGYCVPRLN